MIHIHLAHSKQSPNISEFHGVAMAERALRPDVNGPAEKLITELQQSRKMHMIEHLQASLLWI